MGLFLILISVVTGTVAFISLIRPLPVFWLPTRKRAAIVWIASFVLFATGGSLLPSRTSETQSGRADSRGSYKTGTEVASEARGVLPDREEVADAANIENNQPETPCIPRKLSEASIELVRLYDQLHAFKDEPEFIRMGFASPGPYFAWLQAIEERHNTSGLGALGEVGFLPGDVMLLGMSYVGENLSDSDLSDIEFRERKIQAGLARTTCDEIDSNWRETIQASLNARQSYAAEAEAQISARESLLGRRLTDEEHFELAMAEIRDIARVTNREDVELALCEVATSARPNA